MNLIDCRKDFLCRQLIFFGRKHAVNFTGEFLYSTNMEHKRKSVCLIRLKRLSDASVNRKFISLNCNSIIIPVEVFEKNVNNIVS